MRWALGAVVLPLSLACCSEGRINPVPGPSVGYVSGSRLRARARSSAPGARVLVGWQDTKLGAPCAFAPTEDGETRCVPSGAEVVFLDQLCEQPIAVASSSCGGAKPTFASATFPAASCGGVTRAFRVGDTLSVPNGHVYVGAGASGGCAHATDLDPAAVTYALEPIAPSELVLGTATRLPKTDRLGLEVISAEDGAQQVRGLYDVQTKEPCFSIASAIGGGEDRCVPNAVAWATYAADPTCSEPVAYQVRPEDSCPAANVVVAYAFSGCNVRASYNAPGAPVSIDDVFTGSAPVCTRVLKQPDLYAELDRDHVFFTVGAAIAPTSFAPLRSQTAGFGRLAIPVLSADDGTPLAPPRTDVFFDTTLGVPCRAFVFPDGTKRCVPRDAVPISTPSYSDDACTTEVVGLPIPPGCAANAPVYGVRVNGSACTTTDVGATEVVALSGDLANLPAYYAIDAHGACARQPQAGTFANVTGALAKDALAVVVETLE